MRRIALHALEVVALIVALLAGYGYGYTSGHADGKRGLLTPDQAEQRYQQGYQAGLSEVYGALELLQAKYDTLADKPPQIVTTEIEKEVEVPVSPQSWQSLDQVEAMFKGHIYFSGDVAPVGQANICLPEAKGAQIWAMTQGLPVSVALAWNGWYYGTKVTDTDGGHAGLLVNVGTAWYFVDQSPWKVTKLFEAAK